MSSIRAFWILTVTFHVLDFRKSGPRMAGLHNFQTKPKFIVWQKMKTFLSKHFIKNRFLSTMKFSFFFQPLPRLSHQQSKYAFHESLFRIFLCIEMKCADFFIEIFVLFPVLFYFDDFLNTLEFDIKIF
jgi:hypothetical protein